MFSVPCAVILGLMIYLGEAITVASERVRPINPQDWVKARPAAVIHVPSSRQLVAKISDNEVWDHSLVKGILHDLVDPAVGSTLGRSPKPEEIESVERLVVILSNEIDVEAYLFIESGVPVVQSWTLAIACGDSPQQEFEDIINIAESLIGGFVSSQVNDERHGNLAIGGDRTTSVQWVHAQGWLWVFPRGGPGEETARRVEANKPPEGALAESRRWINSKVEHRSRPDADLYAYLDPNAARSFADSLPDQVWHLLGLSDLISVSAAVEFESDDRQGLVEVDLFGRIAVPRRGVWQALTSSGRIDQVSELPNDIRYAQFIALDFLELGKSLQAGIATSGEYALIDSMNTELQRMGDLTVPDLLEAFDGQLTLVGIEPNEDTLGDFWIRVGIADRAKAEEFARSYAPGLFGGYRFSPVERDSNLEWFLDDREFRARRLEAAKQIEQRNREFLGNQGRAQVEDRGSRERRAWQPNVGLVVSNEFLFIGTRDRSVEFAESRQGSMEDTHPRIAEHLDALRSSNEGTLPFLSMHFMPSELELQLMGWVRDAEERRQREEGPRIDLTDFRNELRPLSQFQRVDHMVEQSLIRLLIAGQEQVDLASLEAYDETTGFRMTFGLYRSRK